MLESLFIRNLVLVTELQLDFGAGFLTVTGETGAGKSLVLGALKLLAGARAPVSLIRRGANACEVAGTFAFPKNSDGVARRVDCRLEECGLPPRDEGRLLLRRVLTENGSRAFINGSPVTAAILKEFGEILVDIHGPNENHSLLAPSRQLQLLDLYGGCQEALAETAASWRELTECRKELEALRQEGLNPEEQALLEHQLREIDDAALSVDEEEELLERHRIVANAARIQTLAGRLSQGISQGEGSLVDQLVPWIREAEELAQLDRAHGEDFLKRLDGVSNELNDLGGVLEDYASSLEFEPQALQETEERIALLQKLKRRYGPTLQDVLATGTRIRARLARSAERASEMKALAEREEAGRRKYDSACGVLRKSRQAAADALGPVITEKLQRLGFQKALFRVQLDDAPPGMTGRDSVEFLFAPNQGETMAPLRQAASSGEVARVMLAVKTVLSEVDDVPVLVFDEIDANIGGRTASSVAEELHSVGKRHQVFSITHLPLIAAAGDRQYLVEKHLEGERTITGMRCLSPEERVLEITRMLGAEAGDAAAVAHARELLSTMRG